MNEQKFQKKIKKFFCTHFFLFFIFFSGPHIFFAQPNEKIVQNYLNTIRDNTAELTAFFQQMPKGGDLHHHYSGSIYAETYFDLAVEKNFWLNTKTLEVTEFKNKSAGTESPDWIQFSDLRKQKTFPSYKEKLLELWSAKDFNGITEPSYKHFFDAFGHFPHASDSIDLVNGLNELKKRAQSENVQYIETMFIHPKGKHFEASLSYFDDILHDLQNRKAEKVVGDSLQALTAEILRLTPNFNEDNIALLRKLKKIHLENNFDDNTFTLRYQCFVTRFQKPVAMFNEIFNAFYLASSNDLIVGVNIVAPEHEDVSMNDYWLHCRMFKFCHELFPNVKYAMHAGELRMGLVKPEDLTWHIDEAVRVSKANRIGHGVDIATERNVYDLLKYMRNNNVAVELNLVSNEFILGVKNDAHPIALYKKAGVPIVLCTDDAGVLRTDLTDQFVLLAARYKNISYKDIKKFVYNSIDYSFIKEQDVKDKLKKQLKDKFNEFEKRVVNWSKNSNN